MRTLNNLLIVASATLYLLTSPNVVRDAVAQVSHSPRTATDDPDRLGQGHQGPPPAETLRAMSLCDAGQQLQDQGKLDEALQTYQKALAIDRHLIPAYLGIGDIYFSRQQYPKALTAFQAASAGIIDTDTQFRIALTYSRMRRYGDAVEAYQNGLTGAYIPPNLAPAFSATISPQSRDMPMLEGLIWLYRGWLMTSSLQADKAMPLLKQAILAKPGLAEAHLLLGLCLNGTGHPDEAREEWTQASTLGVGPTAEQAKRMLRQPAKTPHR